MSVLPVLLVERADEQLHRTDESGRSLYDPRQLLFFAPNERRYKIGNGRFRYHAANLVYNSAWELGYAIPVFPLRIHPRMGHSYIDLASTFEALAGRGRPELRRYLRRFFEMVAPPGALVGPLREGDLLLRGPTTTVPFGHIAIIVDPTLREVSDPFFAATDGATGLAVQCIDSGLSIHTKESRFGRALADNSGRLRPSRMVVRLAARSAPTIREVGSVSRVQSNGAFDREEDGGSSGGGDESNPFASWVPDDQSLVLLVADGKLFMLPSSRLGTIIPPEAAPNVDWSRVILANDLGTFLGLPPVGAGASRVFKAGPRLAVMLDAGRNPQRQPAAVYLDHLSARMRDLGATELRAVILIHAHSDHVNELARVIQEYGISPNNVIVPREYLSTQPTLELQRALQALQSRFGASWQPATLSLRPASSRTELLSGRYSLGETTFEFRAIGSATRLESHTDSASLLVRVSRRGEPNATLVLGDLRGRDLETFQSLMGADRWNDFVKDVRIIDGFSHHGGRIEERDQPGLMRLLESTLLRNGRLSVTLQTDPGQHEQARSDTLELLRRIGVEVHAANVALTTEPSGVRTTGSTVTTSGPAAQSPAPIPSRLTETLSRIERLQNVRDVMAIWAPYIGQRNPEFDAKAELARLDQSLDELRRPTRDALVAAFNVRVAGERTSSGGRDYVGGSSGTAFASALARIPQTTAAETALGEEGLTGLQALRDVPSKEVPLRIALTDALQNGRYSEEAFRYMVSQLDPATLRGIFTGPRGGPRDRASAWRRLRAEFGFRQAVLGDTDMMSASHLAPVPRAGAKAVAGLLIFIELVNLAADITQTYRLARATAQNTNVVPFLRRIKFWRQLKAKAAEVAVDDGWTSARFERDPKLIDDGLEAGTWNFLYLEHTATRPVLSDAEVLKVVGVLGYNVRNYDEYASLFVDSDQDAIRFVNGGRSWTEARWEVCVGEFNTSGANHIDERWVELPKLTEGMRQVSKRIIANTRTLLERAGRGESTSTQELGTLQTPSGSIRSRARLRSGITSSNVELRPFVPPQWGGQSSPQPPLVRQVSWQTNNRPQFYVWEETATHLHVSGSDFDTYIRLRDLKTQEYRIGTGRSDPDDPRGPVLNELQYRIVGNETADAWVLRSELELLPSSRSTESEDDGDKRGATTTASQHSVAKMKGTLAWLRKELTNLEKELFISTDSAGELYAKYEADLAEATALSGKEAKTAADRTRLEKIGERFDGVRALPDEIKRSMQNARDLRTRRIFQKVAIAPSTIHIEEHEASRIEMRLRKVPNTLDVMILERNSEGGGFREFVFRKPTDRYQDAIWDGTFQGVSNRPPETGTYLVYLSASDDDGSESVMELIRVENSGNVTVLPRAETGPQPTRLFFDGSFLTLEDAGKNTIRASAVSGMTSKNPHNREQRDYTLPSCQFVKDHGPLPAGSYEVKKNSVQRPSLVTVRGKDVLRYASAAGARGWGPYRMPILPSTCGRENFFIHLDVHNDGTAGCVGIQTSDAGKFYQIMKILMHMTVDRVPLEVRYPADAGTCYGLPTKCDSSTTAPASSEEAWRPVRDLHEEA